MITCSTHEKGCRIGRYDAMTSKIRRFNEDAAPIEKCHGYSNVAEETAKSAPR
jgi:hypothetical protein